MKYCADCSAPVRQRIPAGDNRQRFVCDRCGVIHYQNPKIVVGCVPQRDGRILLCRRAIEPRLGYWTLPAGFMELKETLQEGAARETFEEACAEVEIGRLFAVVDVLDAGQVHFFFTADLLSGHAAGSESLETRMFAANEIPWPDLAFKSVAFALERYLEDGLEGEIVHHWTLSRSALSTEAMP